MTSEMQVRIARAIYDAPTTFDGDQIAVHLGLSMHVDGSAKDADDTRRIVMQMCMDAALAAMKAMREPTRPMVDAGVAYALNVTVSGAGSWSEYVTTKHQHMLDAEISLAEGGSDD